MKIDSFPTAQHPLARPCPTFGRAQSPLAHFCKPHEPTTFRIAALAKAIWSFCDAPCGERVGQSPAAMVCSARDENRTSAHHPTPLSRPSHGIWGRFGLRNRWKSGIMNAITAASNFLCGGQWVRGPGERRWSVARRL